MFKSVGGGQSVFWEFFTSPASPTTCRWVWGGGCRGGWCLEQPPSEGRAQWYRVLDGLLTWAVRSHPQAVTDMCPLTTLTLSLSSPTLPVLLIYPFVSHSLLISYPFLFLSSYAFSKSKTPTSQSLKFLLLSFSLLPPSLALFACGGLWVNSRFFISPPLAGWGSAHASPLWEMSVSVCWESRGPFTSHQTRCHMEAAKWRLTGHSIEPNHLYQMWQQGKEDVW